MFDVLSALGLLTVALPLPGRGSGCSTHCSCNWVRDPVKAKQNAAVVVDAVALDSTPSRQAPPPGGLFRVRIIVRQVWKGSVPDTVSAYTGEPAGGCGFYFEAGHRFLLFLYRGDDGKLLATYSSLSQPLERADSILMRLGRPLRKGAA